MLRKETAFPRWRAMDRRWNKNTVSLLSSVTSVVRLPISYYYYYFFDPGTQFPRNEKITLCNIKKVQKSSWNEPYSSSSFTKQSCSKMALYRWIKTESRWNRKLISLSSHDWSASLRPSFERKTRPEALIGPNDSTALLLCSVISCVVLLGHSRQPMTGRLGTQLLWYTESDSDVISFHIYASWFSPPSCG